MYSGLGGIGDNVDQAIAYLRGQWQEFLQLGPKIIDLQHRAAELAYAATQRGDDDAAAAAKTAIRTLGALNVRHGQAIDAMRGVAEYVGLSGYRAGYRGLGAVPVAAAAGLTGLALTVAWFFRAYAQQARLLDMIEDGTITAAEAERLTAGVGAAPAQLVGGLADLARYALIAGVGYFAWQVWQSRPKRKRRPARRNPPMVVFDANPPTDDSEVFGEEVYGLWYRHAEDGGNWFHEFGPGVEMTAHPDGSVGLSHSGGRRVWEEF